MKRIHSLVFAAAVLGTLAFGVATATAQPQRKNAEGICPFARTHDACTECCGAYAMAGYFDGVNCGCF